MLSGSAKDLNTRLISIDSGKMQIRLVETVPPRPFLFEPTIQISATLPDGSDRRCEEIFCLTHAAALRGVGWNEHQREVIIAYEADYSARTTIFGWMPETGKTRVIREADGSLDGGSTYSNKPCAANEGYLFCIHAGPTSPPKLVRVDSETGIITPLFDPNPDLRGRHYNAAQFLTWQDDKGNNFSGVLVLPREGKKPSPLVITSYRCRGFLKGGFTSLAPEQILADRGIAALCVNHNNGVGMSAGPDGKVGTLAPHLGAITAYRAIIDQLASEKIVDPSRVGMAGHSFTSMVAAYALSHTNIFKTVVIGTGITIDPATLMYTNTVRDSWENGLLEVLNMPHPLDDSTNKWKAISPALNAAAIKGSLLIQTPENEYLSAVQLFAALEHAGGMVDMYIYPNEGHFLTREPAHQLSRMGRSIDWFTFWLGGNDVGGLKESDGVRYWQRLKNERSPHAPRQAGED
jgi:dipeptidyl aminopeptidase/acylaminoacyl peptidase